MDAENDIEDSSVVNDDSFHRQKDKLYLLALETHSLTRKLKSYAASYNKVDKNFTLILEEAVDTISNFLENAEAQESDDKFNVLDLLPSVESEICETHRYYHCKACNVQVRASAKSFNDHFYGNFHLKKLRNYEKSLGRKENLKGSLQSLTESTDSSKVVSLPKAITAIEALPKKVREFMTTSDLDSFTANLLTQSYQIVKSNTHVRVCNQLQKQLSFRYPKVKAYPFGSMVIELGTKNGDLDIYVDIGDCYFQKPAKRIMKNSIHTVKEILRSSGNSWSDFEPVVHARTPILRAYCRAEGIDCDLSFSNGLSSCNTALIGYFVSLQPVCKKLVMFLKHWQQHLQLGLNSYIISLLVIFYLQQHQLLPPVHFLQERIPPVFIDGWRCNFESIDLVRLKLPLATDFMTHLQGFFKYYGYDFDYKNRVVSVLAGCTVPKSMFDHGQEEKLPPIFERFKGYMASINLEEADEVEDLFSNHKPFVIQDPYELCHNVAKGVQPSKLKKIIHFMQQCHEILAARKK